MENCDQHHANGLTFTPVPCYMRYFFFSFLHSMLKMTVLAPSKSNQCNLDFPPQIVEPIQP